MDKKKYMKCRVMSRVCVLFCHSSSARHTSSKYMRIQLLLSKAQTFYGITILWGIFISPRMEPKEHNMISLYTCCIRIFLFLPPCSISRLVSSLSHAQDVTWRRCGDSHRCVNPQITYASSLPLRIAQYYCL